MREATTVARGWRTDTQMALDTSRPVPLVALRCRREAAAQQAFCGMRRVVFPPSLSTIPGRDSPSAFAATGSFRPTPQSRHVQIERRLESDGTALDSDWWPIRARAPPNGRDVFLENGRIVRCQGPDHPSAWPHRICGDRPTWLCRNPCGATLAVFAFAIVKGHRLGRLRLKPKTRNVRLSRWCVAESSHDRPLSPVTICPDLDTVI